MDFPVLPLTSESQPCSVSVFLGVMLSAKTLCVSLQCLVLL